MLLGGLCLLGLGLRLLGLANIWYHPDEVSWIVRRMWPSPNIHFFNYPGLVLYLTYALDLLFYLLAKFLLGGLGVVSLGDFFSVPRLSLLFWGRLPSVLFGSAAIVWGFGLGKGLAGRIAGLYLAGLMAFSPILILHSHYGTVDMALTCWLFISLGLSFVIWRTGAKFAYLLGGLTLGLASATKYNGILAGLPLLAGHFFRTWPHWAGRAKFAKILFQRQWLTSLALAFVTFCLLNPLIFFDWPEAYKDFQYEFGQKLNDGTLSASQLLANLRRGCDLVGDEIGLVQAALAAGGLIWLWRRSAPATAILLIYLMSHFGLICLASPRSFASRYALPIFPGLLVLVAIGGQSLVTLTGQALAKIRWSCFPPWFWPKILPAIVFLALFWGQRQSIMTTLSLFVFPDTRQLATLWIRDNIPLGARVFVEDNGGYGPYVPDDLYQVRDFSLGNRKNDERDLAVMLADGERYIITSSMLRDFNQQRLNPAFDKALSESPRLRKIKIFQVPERQRGFHNPVISVYEVIPGLVDVNLNKK
jgi:4-amino-4-deoxy-L-arabinose transferase-like glycosyltransferase